MQVDVVSTVTQADTAAVWTVYDDVFGDTAYDDWLVSPWGRHTARAGFRLARGFVADELVGFAYGYTGERGQWWSDAAASVLAPDVADSWIGGHFEAVSLGVLPAHRGHGLGDALLSALTADLPHARLVLMTTADPDDPARRLYARTGWRVLGPGLEPHQAIMGRRAAEGFGDPVAE
ncbi:GNAT family N-acetyltransferase [Nocardioides sp.]|uniref:GNAT family N-acetyltransferase n=1 Tax=Nocardioides sp. TaxID=35761 RepID=UPI002C4EB134|nr:GNAT family N-acetyltransferase [Nocardioides sp.]HXH78357.1 GNAT family N-acetyltransferase [Nocardioides sp.]